ncbi:hypothetical protein J3E69DRAFT_343352 [Trichoderma sp. SZMC 28015]
MKRDAIPPLHPQLNQLRHVLHANINFFKPPTRQRFIAATPFMQKIHMQRTLETSIMCVRPLS